MNTCIIKYCLLLVCYKQHQTTALKSIQAATWLQWDLFKRILVKEITWLYFSKPAQKIVFYTKNALFKKITWVLCLYLLKRCDPYKQVLLYLLFIGCTFVSRAPNCKHCVSPFVFWWVTFWVQTVFVAQTLKFQQALQNQPQYSNLHFVVGERIHDASVRQLNCTHVLVNRLKLTLF